MAASGEVPPEIYSTLMGFDVSGMKDFPPFFCCLPFKVLKFLQWRCSDLNNNLSRLDMWNEFKAIQKTDVFSFDRFLKSLCSVANGEKTFFEILDDNCSRLDFIIHPPSRIYMLICIWISLMFWEKQIKYSTRLWKDAGSFTKNKHHDACFKSEAPHLLRISTIRMIYPRSTLIDDSDSSKPKPRLDAEPNFHRYQCEQTARDIHRMLTAFTISWFSLSEQEKKELILEFPFITGLMYQPK